MPVTEKTVFQVTRDDGTSVSEYNSREEAERADLQARIADELANLMDEEGDLIVKAAHVRDMLAWHARDVYAIMKRHLEPIEPRELSEDEQGRACDALCSLLGSIGPSAEEIENGVARHNTIARLVNSILDHRNDVVSILSAQPAKPQRKPFDVLEAPIDEAQAILAFQNMFRNEPTGLSVGDTIAHIMANRGEVVAILQGIEKPSQRKILSRFDASRRLVATFKRDKDDLPVWCLSAVEAVINNRHDVQTILQAIRDDNAS